MRVLPRSAGLAGAVLGAFLSCAAAVWAQPGSIPPVFSQRLRVPIRGDDFTQPRAVVADPHTGEIFVADGLRNRIVIFDQEGRFRYQIQGGSAFQSPVDLAVDPEGYLFVLSQVSADISWLDFDGRLIRKLVLTGLPEGTSSPRLTSIAMPHGGERLYLLDTANHRLWITDRDAAIQDSIDLTTGRTAEEITQLRYGHVDIYGDNVLLPISSDGLVHRFDLGGRAQGAIGSPGSSLCQTMFPSAAALDSEGRLIVLDRQRALFMTWDLDRGVCLSEHYGFGNAPGAMYQPSDLALDGAGRVYVSQGFEGRIQVYEGASPAYATAVRPTSPQAAPAAPAQPSIAEVEVTDLEPAAESPALEAPQIAEAPTPAQAPPTEQPTVVAVPEPAPLPPTEEPTVVALPEPAPVPVREPLVAPRPKVAVREPVPPAPVADPAPPAEVAAATEAPPSELGTLIAGGARRSVDNAPRYDAAYVEIDYPGGDLPTDRGAAIDVVIRAFRQAGIDLQQAVHEDLVGNLDAYPVAEPDPSIDHRRIKNLATFFERRARNLSGAPGGDWAPGDVVFWDRNSDGVAGHLGIVLAETGPSGNPMVVHHHRPTAEFPGTPAAEDLLFRWPIVGHYRWPAEAAAAAAEESVPDTAPEGLAEVESTVRAWAHAWSEKRIEKYLDLYSADFQPGDGLSRAAWEGQRRARIERPRSIQVSLSGITARRITGDRAEVTFVQAYRSDQYADRVDKVLLLRREAAGWRILAERVVGTYPQ